MLWLGTLLEAVPDGRLQMVTIQFPDPWFKKKHAKRRMVNVELIDAIVGKLAAGGRIFVQTDIEPLAEEMFGLFNNESRIQRAQTDGDPFPVRTERGTAVREKGLPVYRELYEKVHTGSV